MTKPCFLSAPSLPCSRDECVPRLPSCAQPGCRGRQRAARRGAWHGMLLESRQDLAHPSLTSVVSKKEFKRFR